MARAVSAVRRGAPPENIENANGAGLEIDVEDDPVIPDAPTEGVHPFELHHIAE